ncbi:c-type cytochrome biogenesis protein CcmI [Thiocystis violascens]|uniref:Cytochrome c-type biogenesis protein CcmI n=1 Tax=Thiocystis violascens (strain ATCC 17096 / DSM 198 / 6111) TaxID=765911 RepID=I3YD76_THIV6|nr:c-type cytochrome biogenesis protein CcmI [Thiocystis violascens]AFL74944.1 cytochrome c-type biogenesis protein CcmI [Thiocystis violascens DSM 198]
MMIFWILAAGLIGLALSFILLPLARPETANDAPEQDALNLDVFNQRLRELDADLGAGFLDQDQYAAARRDLERDLLRDVDGDGTASSAGKPTSALGRWGLATILTLAVPSAAVLMYLQLGDLEIAPRLEAAASGQPLPADGAGGQDAPSMEVLVERLEARMKENPANLEGWLMLGRTYFAMDQRDQGLDAISKAYELAPNQTEVMLAYAEALAAASDTKSLEGKPAELIGAALQQEPANANARWLDGMISYQRGQYQTAAVAWQKILDELEPGSEEANNLRQMVDEANSRAGQPETASTPTIGAPATAPAPVADESPSLAQSDPIPASVTATPEPAAGASLAVEVTLDPAIAPQVRPDQTVFVFARAAAGPPMPLAALRLRVKDLPRSVTLDDSLAMNPAMRLSAFPEVIVGARVSRTGQATPQAGDLEGEIGPIQLDGTRQVSVRIDRVRP